MKTNIRKIRQLDNWERWKMAEPAARNSFTSSRCDVPNVTQELHALVLLVLNILFDIQII